MNSEYVTDTMALVLRLEQRRLSKPVKELFEAAENGKINILIPAMVLAEIGYLSEKKKIDTNIAEARIYRERYPTILVEDITDSVIDKTFQIDDIPELHDRIIAATAAVKGRVIITNDPVITKSTWVTAIW